MRFWTKTPSPLHHKKLERDGLVRYWTNEEKQQLRQLIQARCPHNLPSLDVAIHTGVRSREQHSIRWWQVDFERKALFIQKNRAETKKGRAIELNAVALAAFRTLRTEAETRRTFAKDDHVLRNGSGEALRGHRDWFDPILAGADLGDFAWHCLRHIFASRLVMAGVDLRTVGELLAVLPTP